MSREVRKVPADWEHPKEFNEYQGREVYKPLFDGGYSYAAEDWAEGERQWNNGFRRNYGDGPDWKEKDADMNFLSPNGQASGRSQKTTCPIGPMENGRTS